MVDFEYSQPPDQDPAANNEQAGEQMQLDPPA